MAIKFVGILLLIFSIGSCQSKTTNDRNADSSIMMDSSIMNNPDTLDKGPDTSVIDTADTIR